MKYHLFVYRADGKIAWHGGFRTKNELLKMTADFISRGRGFVVSWGCGFTVNWH